MTEGSRELEALRIEVSMLRQREATFSMLAGDDFAESLHDALDQVGAPRKSGDGMVTFGLVQRILSLSRTAPDGGRETYAGFQQQRGRLPDLIEEAIAIYDDYMMDDDYDAQGCLDRVAAKLRSARDFYRPAAIRALADGEKGGGS